MKFILIILMSFLPLYAFAGEAQDIAEDPVLEKRMIGLAEKLRCLVCQNESIASSHAELAQDLRREVRELMQKGMNDKQIKDYLVARYGDFVLYDPPIKKTTWLLWYGPGGLLLIGLATLAWQLRRRKNKIVEVELSAADIQRATDMLNPPKDPSA